MPGFGSLRPDSMNTSTQSRSASLPLAIASSIVSPSDMHPGISGYSTRYPPPSSRERRRTVNWYASRSRFVFALMLFNLSGGVDQSEKLPNINGLDGPLRRHGYDLRHPEELKITVSRFPRHEQRQC